MVKGTILDESGLNLTEDDIATLLISSEVEQGSDQWFEERLGKATASMFKVVVARDRYGKPYKGYYDYMLELVVERITNNAKRFNSKITDWGKDNEAPAADLYEELHPDSEVRECGFIEHPTLAAGASPDRLIDEDGTMEIKAPQSTTFVKYMLSHIPDDSPHVNVRNAAKITTEDWKYYYDQIQGQLWITGRKWNDHVIFDPAMPENVQLSVTRIERDDKYITEILEPRIIEFLKSVDLIENYIRNYEIPS